MLNKKALAAARVASGAVTDPDFEYVTMLLHGDGTNGAQNNTFIDGSTNNFTITRNGNTTQGSFNPFGDRWSNYFDGDTDWLEVANNSAFNLSSSNFTVEAWVYPTTSGTDRIIIAKNQGTYPAGYEWGIYISSGNLLGFNGYGSSLFYVLSTATIRANVWTHVAAVRNGSTLTIYINGVSSGSVTPQTIQTTTSSVSIARDLESFGGGRYFSGYISNARVVKGTAVYTANFTPPTAPLTAITNTSLLTCQSNRFIDNSSNNFTITRNGDVSVRPFNPFSPTAAYSTSTNGGSGYFDGTGDYLTAASNAAFEFGTGQYTVEFWVYFNSIKNYDDFVTASNDATSGRWCIYYNGGQWQVVRTGGGGATTYTMTPVARQWYHIAATRDSSNNQRLFINGELVATATSTNNYSQSGFRVGYNSYNSASPPLDGYISNLRVIKGTAQYTAAFTPPTAPLTAITNTSFLLNFTNGGIIDNAADNVLETVGNAQISTSVKKYGTGSLAFDGTGDRLTTPASVDANMTTGDFTVECWVYSNTTAVGDAVAAYRGSQSVTTGSDIQWSIYRSGTSMIVRPYSGSTDYSINVGTITANTWYHVALTRSGNTFRGFLNGTVSGTTQTISGALNDNAAWFGANIGNMTVGGSDAALNGYIDDLRISKGVARYTANFTPPTAAFPDA